MSTAILLFQFDTNLFKHKSFSKHSENVLIQEILRFVRVSRQYELFGKKEINMKKVFINLNLIFINLN